MNSTTFVVSLGSLKEYAFFKHRKLNALDIKRRIAADQGHGLGSRAKARLGRPTHPNFANSNPGWKHCRVQVVSRPSDV